MPGKRGRRKDPKLSNLQKHMQVLFGYLEKSIERDDFAAERSYIAGCVGLAEAWNDVELERGRSARIIPFVDHDSAAWAIRQARIHLDPSVITAICSKRVFKRFSRIGEENMRLNVHDLLAIQNIATQCIAMGVTKIISVGCGHGLFEYLLKETLAALTPGGHRAVTQQILGVELESFGFRPLIDLLRVTPEMSVAETMETHPALRPSESDRIALMFVMPYDGQISMGEWCKAYEDHLSGMLYVADTTTSLFGHVAGIKGFSTAPKYPDAFFNWLSASVGAGAKLSALIEPADGNTTPIAEVFEGHELPNPATLKARLNAVGATDRECVAWEALLRTEGKVLPSMARRLPMWLAKSPEIEIPAGHVPVTVKRDESGKVSMNLAPDRSEMRGLLVNLISPEMGAKLADTEVRFFPRGQDANVVELHVEAILQRAPQKPLSGLGGALALFARVLAAGDEGGDLHAAGGGGGSGGGEEPS